MSWQSVAANYSLPADVVSVWDGRIAMPSRLRHTLGDPQWVAVSVDTDRGLLGLRPVSYHIPSAYKVSRKGVVSCRRALVKLGVKRTDPPVRRPATLVDGRVEVAMRAEALA